MKLWRRCAADVPRDSDDALTRWLYERWIELDDWFDEQRNGASGANCAVETAEREYRPSQ
jgi:hypothetical protein